MTLRRNIYYSFIGQWVSTTLAFCTTVLVSRLLTPHEVGVFALGLAVNGLVAGLQNFGTKEFIVQKVDLDEAHRRAAFGVSIVTGLVASLLVASASLPIAHFYDTPELVTVILILATNPFLHAIVAPISSMLTRERLFLTIRTITVISAAVSMITAVTLSYFDFSFYSLAFASLASSLCNVVSHWILGRRFVLVRPAFRGARAVFSFGTKVYLANVLKQAATSTRVFIIAKVLGVSSTAIFHRASDFSTVYARLAGNALDGVLTAEYAAQNRMGGDIAHRFLFATRHMSAIAWPFFGAAAIYADPVIRVLYGDQWTAAIMPMRILCVASSFWPLNSPAISIILGTGAVDLNLRIRIVQTAVYVSMVLVAAPYGLNAIAIASVASAVLMFAQYTRGARKKAHFTARQYLDSLMPSVVTSIMALVPAGGVYWVGQGLGFPSVILLLLGALATILGWLAGLFLTKHPLLGELRRVAKRGLMHLGIFLPDPEERQTLRG